MTISIIRRPSAHGCTLSSWYVDGAWQCFGIEDVVRGPAEAKVFGKTAIPVGTYRVVVTMSTRFKRLLPLLIDLPGKVTLFGNRPIGACGVRIHPGNWATDTEACLLPGTAIAANNAMVLNSRAAFNILFARIQAAFDTKELITLIIR